MRAAVAICTLLVAAAAYGEDLLYNFENLSTKFNKAVESAARAAIAASTLQLLEPGLAETRKELALQVCKSIHEMEDPTTKRCGDRFDSAFSCLVWNAKIPDLLQSTFTPGDPLDLSTVHNRIAKQGAMLLQGCNVIRSYKQQTRRLLPPLDDIGEYGWPCPYGSAVLLQENTVHGYLQNCLVYHYPPLQSAAFQPLCLWESFEHILDATWESEEGARIRSALSRNIINLNELAFRFDSHRKKMAPSKNTFSKAYLFKAVAFIPVLGYPSPWPISGFHQDILTSVAGLVSPLGHFCIQYMPVALPVAQNDRYNPPIPMGLLVIAAAPYGASGCGGAKGSR